MVDLPENPIRKAVRNPSSAATWIRNRIIEERVVTSLRARYLFDYEWDLAIILDACRFDLAEERAADHPIRLGQPERVYSAASNSADWIRRTFGSASDQVLSKTAYITGNLYTNKLPDTELAHLDRVWRYAWDEEKGCVLPRPLTDRTITAARNDVAEKYIVHYMQPHLPPIADKEYYEPMRTTPSEGGGANEKSAWERVRNGEISGEAVRAAYKDNLFPVLDDVQLLVENFDASKVVITADHGNYLGEKGQWGHPNFEMSPPVRHVPWWETTASDNYTHSPDEYDTEAESPSRDEQLRALGYR